jgi:Txe/YoeB family toxin of Txe-Axe toxin-antitoxin module
MQEIPRANLVPGKEYYLQCFEPSCMSPNESYKMIAKFEKLVESFWNPIWQWACFTNFRKLENRNDSSYTRRVELGYHWRFYDVPSHKVQKNMENRAYYMILLDLIQDEYFKPIELI